MCLTSIVCFNRMYQALLASGDHESAKKVLVNIPKDDTHNRMIIKACRKIFPPAPA